MAARTILFCCLLAVSCLHAYSTDDLMILVTDRTDELNGDIYSINTTSDQASRVKLWKVIRPVSIVYDEFGDRMYWSDVVSKQIRSARLDGTDEEVFLDLSTESVVDGITVDGEDRLMFYTDNGQNTIVKVSIDTPLQRFVLTDRDVDKPRGITVYRKKRKILWTDWKTWACIEMCDYDGGNRKALVTTDIIWPNGVTIDEISETVYWCDAGTYKLESIQLDGTGRRMILTEQASHFYSIMLFEDILYLTKWNSTSIHLLYKNGTQKDAIILHGSKRLSGLFMLRQSRCPDGQFGSGCRQCGHCSGGESCNKKYGFCHGDCESGFYGQVFRGTGWSMCDETCSCTDWVQHRCDKWTKANCVTTTASTQTTTTTTTTASSSTEMTQSTSVDGLVPDPSRAELSTGIKHADKKIPIALLSFGFVAMAVIAGIATAYAVKYHHERKRLKTYDHLHYRRSVSTATTLTHCGPDSTDYTIMCEEENKVCPDIIVSNSMLDEEEHFNLGCDDVSGYGEDEPRYVSVRTLNKAASVEEDSN